MLGFSTEPGEPQKRLNERDENTKKGRLVMINIVDDLANHNKAPLLVRQGSGWMPLYCTDYDWKEDQRVSSALAKLQQERCDELWDELVRRSNDKHYCRTLKDKNEHFALGNWTVGMFCSILADDWLLGICEQHLPSDPDKDGYRISLDYGISKAGGLPKWRNERSKKALYELQIDICEEAILEIAKMPKISQREEVKARKKIQGEIATLRRIRRAIFTDYSSMPMMFYHQKEAENIRRLLQKSDKSKNKDGR